MGIVSMMSFIDIFRFEWLQGTLTWICLRPWVWYLKPLGSKLLESSSSRCTGGAWSCHHEFRTLSCFWTSYLRSLPTTDMIANRNRNRTPGPPYLGDRWSCGPWSACSQECVSDDRDLQSCGRSSSTYFRWSRSRHPGSTYGGHLRDRAKKRTSLSRDLLWFHSQTPSSWHRCHL